MDQFSHCFANDGLILNVKWQEICLPVRNAARACREQGSGTWIHSEFSPKLTRPPIHKTVYRTGGGVVVSGFVFLYIVCNISFHIYVMILAFSGGFLLPHINYIGVFHQH